MLWGKTDTQSDAPKYLSSADADDAYFVDLGEAGVESNRDKGIVTPGWNLYTTYTNALGETRHKVETLVPMKVSAADAGDAGVTGNTAVEDTVVADPE